MCPYYHLKTFLKRYDRSVRIVLNVYNIVGLYDVNTLHRRFKDNNSFERFKTCVKVTQLYTNHRRSKTCEIQALLAKGLTNLQLELKDVMTSVLKQYKRASPRIRTLAKLMKIDTKGIPYKD